MNIILRASLLLVIIASVTVGTKSVSAIGPVDKTPRIMVITVDTKSLETVTNGHNLVKSLLGLTASLRQSDNIYITSLSHPNQIFGPLSKNETTNESYANFLHQISLNNMSGFAQIPESLTEVYTFLGSQKAPAGSSMYLIAGGNTTYSNEYAARALDPISQMFAKSEWTITSFSTADSSENLRSSLARISSNTGSGLFDLTESEDLKSLADRIMTSDSLGALVPSGEGKLNQESILTANVGIAPGTQDATILFFKDEPFGSMRLKNPEGVEASAGDRSFSNITETPYTVIWKIRDPKPGNWTVEVKGLNGTISSWHHTTNKYRLHLNMNEVIPMEKTSSLTAYVTDGELMVTLGSDAVMNAKITNPNGNVVLYELNDEGKIGDVVSGDGYFSTTIPRPRVEGTYNVELELGWKDVPNRISESAQYDAIPFPALDLKPLNTERIYKGQQTNIGTIYVQVKNDPFAIMPSSLDAQIAEGDTSGILEIVPRQIMADGRAWMYDLLYTANQDGRVAMIIGMNLEYAGVDHVHTTESVVLNSITLPVPEPKVLDAPKIAQAPVNDNVIINESQGIPIRIIGIPVAFIALFLAFFIYHRSLTRPFGTITSEQGDTLVDFSLMDRSLISKMFSVNVVHGEEIGLPEFEGITFKFKGATVEMLSDRVAPTVRLNNHPIIGAVELQNQSWIGSHGKLFGFMEKAPGQPSFNEE